EDVVQLPAANALVPPVVEGEHHGVAHDPLQRGQVFGVAGDADHPHAVVDRRDGRLGAVDLRHDRQLLRAPAGALEVMARLPGEVAAGLDPHLDVGEHEADVLVLDDRHGAEPFLAAGEVQRVFEGRAHGPDAGRADQRRRPAERAGDDALAQPAGLADEVGGGHPAASKCTRGVTTPRWPILSYTSITLMPGAEPGTAITASASSAPAAGSVRQTTVYSSQPVRFHPVPLVV